MLGRYRIIECFFVGIFAVVVATSASASPFKIFSPGDPVLEDIRTLSRVSGRSILSLTPPLSSGEIQNVLASIDPDGLSQSAREAYARVRAALEDQAAFRDGKFGFAVHPALTLEGRARTNGDVDWTKPERDSRPFFSVPIEFFMADSVYAAGNLDLRSDPSFYDGGSSLLGTNVPYATERLDLNIPLRAFMAAGGSWWSFQLGRDKLDFGSAFTGNLAVSDGPDYHEFARLSLFSPNFKYSLLVSHLPLSVDNLAADGYGPAEDALESTTQRYFYYHRWDFRLFNRLSVGLGEGAMVGNSALELRFLNPLALYHGFFSWDDYDSWKSESGAEGDMVGSLMNLELDWAIAPSFALYGQFVMNQFATSYEKEHWPEDGSPNGLGFLAGAEYVTAFRDLASAFAFEFVYADPYLYELSSPFASYIWMRRLSELSKKKPRYAWIGHPEGRDFILFALRARFSKDPYDLTLRAAYKLQGEHGMQWDWEKGSYSSSQTAPSGTAERRAVLSAELGWRLLPRLSFGAYGAVAHIADAGHVKGDEEIGAETMFSVTYTF
jgi:hypothetical protein